MRTRIGLVVGCATLLLLSCKAAEDSPAVDAPVAPGGDSPASAWLGRWIGPEGTDLVIATGDGRYTVTVSNLDGPRTFGATPSANGLAFDRDGIRESIRASDGPGTGMKWLQSKRDCLVIRPGEGFCRD
jgi:hypothetical protein